MDLSRIYNNEEEIKNYVKDLKTLHDIINMRHEAGYKFGIRLNSFKLLDNYLLMDTCGNTMPQVDNRIDAYYSGRIPNDEDTCPYCEKGWNLHNIKDHYGKYDYENNTMIFFHKECNKMKKLEEQRNEFMEIFSLVYEISTLKFKPIPNEYSDGEWCAPWFLVTTSDGDIRIGWRKRVINIEWLDSYKLFSETFNNEDVTRGFGKYQDNSRFIHAWSVDKCIEYLIRAKTSILP